ncbi:hypothetical protein EIP91_000340 [Steccherinum ochraceum]|uniref:Uncharacterized protein n=1 Tax=Steccherinum ochraceum TaxID=92696 RepID=A0A4R0RK39_9APHY|nr:hypothetical protein EIP91_000340 [Steccherinum ochraceum]
MHLAAIFTCALAVAASSAVAVPLHGSQMRGDQKSVVVARRVVARDILQAIHARELAALDARTIDSTFLVKRGGEHSSMHLPKLHRSGRSANAGNTNAGGATNTGNTNAPAAGAANANPQRPPAPPHYPSNPPTYEPDATGGHTSAGPPRPHNPLAEPETPHSQTESPPPPYAPTDPRGQPPAVRPGPGASNTPVSSIPAPQNPTSRNPTSGNSRQFSSNLNDAFARYNDSP